MNNANKGLTRFLLRAIRSGAICSRLLLVNLLRELRSNWRKRTRIKQPRTFRQIWNMNFGFLGIPFRAGLQLRVACDDNWRAFRLQLLSTSSRNYRRFHSLHILLNLKGWRLCENVEAGCAATRIQDAIPKTWKDRCVRAGVFLPLRGGFAD